MSRQTPRADEFKQKLRDSLRRVTLDSRALKIARHQNVYTCGDQDEMVYFIESGQIKLLMLSSEGKECLLAIHCEARRAQGNHRLTSLKIFYRESVDKKEKAHG